MFVYPVLLPSSFTMSAILPGAEVGSETYGRFDMLFILDEKQPNTWDCDQCL